MSKAAPSSKSSPELAAAQARNRQLEGTVHSLEEKVESLEQQLDWFKRQLFGRKSEKRELEDNPLQPLLNGFNVDCPNPDPLGIRTKRTRKNGSAQEKYPCAY